MASPLAAFLSPKCDPDLDFARRPYDESETWPSELVFGGEIGWTTFETGPDGWTEILYPDMMQVLLRCGVIRAEDDRWDQLRSDHGWAALQHQSVLRTSLSIPSIPGRKATPILIDVSQGTEFALIPRDTESTTPTIRYTGDVYAYATTPSGTLETNGSTSNFARSLAMKPGGYTLLARAMYEIRMFGDPGVSKPPVIRLKVQVDVDEGKGVEVVKGTSVVPDLVDGWFMGDRLSVGLGAPAGEMEVLVTSAESNSVAVDLAGPVRILDGQLRPVALRIKQDGPLFWIPKTMTITFKVIIAGEKSSIKWQVQLRDVGPHSTSPFKITVTSPEHPARAPPALVSFAIAIPPKEPSPDIESPSPVILALHGAGVDIENPLWIGGMPSRPGGWAVLPTRKNEWGEDWHGGSMADAWAARDALPGLIQRLGVTVSGETLLIGHSNGGQGARHLAARHPEKIVGGE